VSLWNIVEGHDIIAELAQEVCAERDEGPEGKLNPIVSILPVMTAAIGWTMRT
jgi:hypothetical protein